MSERTIGEPALHFGFGRSQKGSFYVGKVDFLSTCETKAACKFSQKSSQKALNRVLTLPHFRSHREDPEIFRNF